MSGKRAKSNRKKLGLSKKLVAASVVGLCLGTTAAVSEGNILVSLYPHYTIPFLSFSSSMENGVGLGAKVTYRPIQYLNIFVNGDYQNFGFGTADSVDNLSVWNAGGGVGYHLPITDRFGMDLNANVGYYSAGYGDKSLSGMNVGATLGFSFKINPVISVDAAASGVHYMAGSTGLFTGAQLSPGITFNLTRAFRNSTNVAMEVESLDPVFPVLYSWYDKNSFGKIKIKNNEDATITDVKVSFYQPQYMGLPSVCKSINVMEKEEEVEVDLKAFFNEQMLELIEKNDTQAEITVEYKYLGQKKSANYVMIVPVYGRNNMSWVDDRCASVFVSSKDPAAMWFAKYITSVVRDNVRTGVAQNIQYAMGIFEALDQFGLNYVIDPTSAFADNVGSASIDFLQFPYQTLMYRGGDCDDLSILVCSLFEAIGIRTAFITIPGHIYMAFNTGLDVEEAEQQFASLDELIIDGDEVWIPLEITLTDEGFNKAWRVGAREWNQANANGTAAIYKMKDSWRIYNPVSVPGAQAQFSLPDEQLVGKLFSHSVDDFILRQIEPQIVTYETKIERNPIPENYNDYGVLYARYGLFSKAETQLKKARKQDYLPAILNTANLYYSMKDFGRAQKWYEEVLVREPENLYAKLGIARCAFETSDYELCDKYYKTVYETDFRLARQFSYLGSFEEGQGRSYSLSDRLSNTIWFESALARTPAEQKVIKEEISLVVEPIQEETIVTTDSPVQDFSLPDFMSDNLMLVPDTSVNEEENEEKEEEPKAGDGGKDPYVGISAQLQLDIMSEAELLEAAASVTELETFEIPANFEVPASIELPSSVEPSVEPAFENTAEPSAEIIEETSTEDDFEFEPQVFVEPAVLSEPAVEEDIYMQEETEVVNREVPRFTKQPSEEWAPVQAYTLETIPGMRSYEEEMGNFTNEKAYLYQDEFAFSANPDDDNKTEEEIQQETLETTGDLIAQASTPEVNPFSSFLSEEDAKAVEQITNYVVEKPVVEEVAETKVEEVPVVAETTVEVAQPVAVAETTVEVAEPVVEAPVEVVAEAPVEAAVETVAEEPVVNEIEETKPAKNKGLLALIMSGAIAGVGGAAGAAGVAINRGKKTSKKKEEGKE